MLLREMAVIGGMQGFGMSQYVICTFTVELLKTLMSHSAGHFGNVPHGSKRYTEL